MDSDEFDLAAVVLRKDALLVAYGAKLARWNGVQGAGAGSSIVAAGAYLAGSLPGPSLATVAGLGLLVALAAEFFIRHNDRLLLEGVDALQRQIARLKARGDA